MSIVALPSAENSQDSCHHQSFREPKKYKYVDVMRGTAILLVVLTHTAFGLGNRLTVGFRIAQLGQFGVQLFFVASALTLCLSMSQRGLSVKKTGQFYVRRFFRIAPLYYTGIALYSLLALGSNLLHHGAGVHKSVLNIIVNILFLHGLSPASNNDVVPGGWSIGTEMLFYLMFPLIFVWLTSKRQAAYFIVATVFINLLFQYGRCLVQGLPFGINDNSFWYYLIINQLPVFGCGIFLYYSLKKKAAARPSTDLIITILLSLGVYMVYFHTTSGINFALLPVLAGFAFTYLGRYLSEIKMDNTIADVFAEIGKKSYSIYIFHFLFAFHLIPFIGNLASRVPIQNSNLLLAVMTALYTGLSYAIALFTTRVVETPGIEAGKRLVLNPR